MRRIPYILLVVALFGCNPLLTTPKLAQHKEYIFGDGFLRDSIQLDTV